ncbi:ABC transporter substrate-binding protein [Actinosynnema sp. NPDC059335]|uniref:ABC transporter substrate-binding protein n=1 Tax=Actinosynnema sp. NPDC059335 TaxID=3346804 RepID=UPI00366DC54C
MNHHRRFRRLLAATALAAAAGLTAGCVYVGEASGPGPATRPSSGAQPLKVAVFNNYPPAEYVENGELTGWMIEMLDPLARETGLTFEIVQVTNFSTLIPGLQSGRFDAAAANLTVSAERTEIIDMVTVDAVGTGFSTANGSGIEVRSALDLCGRDVGILSGSVFEPQLRAISDECTAAGAPPARAHLYPDSSSAVLAVGNQRVNVFMGSYSEVVHSANQSGRLTVQPYQFAKLPEAIGFPKGSPHTRAVLDAVNKLIASGEYEALLAKWKVPGIAITESRLNPEVP